MKRLICLVLACAFWVLAIEAQTQKSAPTKEQTDFGAEDNRWERPVPLPTDVLQTLRKTNHANASEYSDNSFLASEIHLGGPHEADLIIKGINNLTLPHGALFWVFRPGPNGHKLILGAGGDALSVLS